MFSPANSAGRWREGGAMRNKRARAAAMALAAIVAIIALLYLQAAEATLCAPPAMM